MSNHVIDDLILQLPLVALRGIAILMWAAKKASMHCVKL